MPRGGPELAPRALPSDWRAIEQRGVSSRMIVLVGLLATVAIVALAALYAGLTRKDVPSSASAARTAAIPSGAPSPTAMPSTSAPPPTVASASSAAPAASAQRAPSAAPSATSATEAHTDPEARAALEKLRTAVQACARRIHQLPGTSPAVPASLARLASGSYQPNVRDWGSPFFACAAFRIEQPMDYVIQWQFKPSSRARNDESDAVGTGIAWVDADRDGAADRAYAFEVSADPKRDFEAGPVKAVDAARAVMKAR